MGRHGPKGRQEGLALGVAIASHLGLSEKGEAGPICGDR